jgi:hypothetical protein
MMVDVYDFADPASRCDGRAEMSRTGWWGQQLPPFVDPRANYVDNS